MLSQEERADLRRRVLMGIPLTLDEARQVIADTRSAQAAITTLDKKPKRAKKTSMSDEDLSMDLDKFLGA